MTTESDLQAALEANLLLIAENRRLREALLTAKLAMLNHKWQFSQSNTIEQMAIHDVEQALAKHGSQS